MRKKKGFSGERIIDVSGVLKEEDFPSLLIFSKMGFFPKARHQFTEGFEKSQYILLYCIEGIGEVVLNDERHILNIGDFILIPHSSRYIYQADEENPWSFYWFYFKDNVNMISDMLAFFYKYNKSYRGRLPYDGERIALFRHIFDSLNKGYSKDNLTMLSMCLMNFLSSLVFCSNKNKPGKAGGRIEDAIELMKKRVESNISLTELARVSNLSVSQFAHLFKDKTGMSALEYYNSLKIKKACRYLENTGLQVKEVAFRVGIQDASYFSRLFQKRIGISPVKYRNELLKK